MVALARVDPLAGGEHASSPVRNAPKGCGLGPFGCPEPFFLVDGAKLLSVNCAAEQRLRRWMIGGWSGENLAVVRRWDRFWNCWVRFWMPQVLFFGSWKMPSATQRSLQLGA